jgi:hypothetical protein
VTAPTSAGAVTHAACARRLLHCTENANGDMLDTAQEGTLFALAGIGYALLDVADAIREQAANSRVSVEATQLNEGKSDRTEAAQQPQPASGMILERIRAAVEAHVTPDSSTQWYVDEYCIDCAAEEFWAVIADVLQDGVITAGPSRPPRRFRRCHLMGGWRKICAAFARAARRGHSDEPFVIEE